MELLRRIWVLWKALGRFVGNLVGRVVLTIFYFTVFVPFGLGTRLLSDPLAIKAVPPDFWLARETQTDTLDSARRQG